MKLSKPMILVLKNLLRGLPWDEDLRGHDLREKREAAASMMIREGLITWKKELTARGRDIAGGLK